MKLRAKSGKKSPLKEVAARSGVRQSLYMPAPAAARFVPLSDPALDAMTSHPACGNQGPPIWERQPCPIASYGKFCIAPKAPAMIQIWRYDIAPRLGCFDEQGKGGHPDIEDNGLLQKLLCEEETIRVSLSPGKVPRIHPAKQISPQEQFPSRVLTGAVCAASKAQIVAPANGCQVKFPYFRIVYLKGSGTTFGYSAW